MTLRPTLYRARWVLPVAAPPIPNGEVLVGRDGRIAAVAPAGALEPTEQMEVRELGNAILLPGLVNVHTHPELGMFKGALEELEFRDWILRLVGAKRSVLRDEDSAAAARWTMVELIRAGITSVGATEMSGAAMGAMREAGMRGILYQEVFGPDPAQVDASMRELRGAVETLSAQTSELVRLGISPHAPYTVSDDLYRAAASFAIAEHLPMAVHIAESRAERDLVVDGGGDFAPGLAARGITTPIRATSPISLLASLGVLDARPLLIHCVDVDQADVHMIAGAGCAVAHCPVANAKLGHGLAPVPEMMEAGVVVGMGTDSVGSNNRLDILEEARVASVLQRARAARPDVFGTEELLRMCTIDGARALGIEDRVGTLEPGKDADLCAISVEAPHTVPSTNPLATLFHAARGADVVLTVVQGRVLYSEGAVQTLDERSAREGVEDAARRLLGFRAS